MLRGKEICFKNSQQKLHYSSYAHYKYASQETVEAWHNCTSSIILHLKNFHKSYHKQYLELVEMNDKPYVEEFV